MTSSKFGGIPKETPVSRFGGIPAGKPSPDTTAYDELTAQGLREEEMLKMLGILGPGLLLGGAREFIYTITSRGPCKAVYLPTVNFVPPTDEHGTGKRSQEKAAKKKPAPKKKAPKK